MASGSQNSNQMRVLSLLPSATDCIVALKLSHCLIGRSHECDWDELKDLSVCTNSRIGDIEVEQVATVMSSSIAAVREMQHLGSSLALPLLEFGLSVYQVDINKLLQLRPTVILTCLQTAHVGITEPNLIESALHTVLGYTPTVVHCEAECLEGVWQDMQRIADAVGASEAGVELIKAQQRQMSGAAATSLGRDKPKVVCLQWPYPLMAAGAWVPELISQAGGIDTLGVVNEAIMLQPSDLLKAQPDVVVFALCGLPLQKATAAAKSAIKRLESVWSELPAVKRGRIAVVDGEHVLSRPGPLLGPSMECLCEIFHDEAQQYGHQGTLWQWI